MPETATKTRDQIAADQIQFILRQDWFQPDTLRRQIEALKEIISSGQKTNLFSAVTIDNREIPLVKIKESLAQLNQALGFRIDPQNLNILNPQHLEQLEQALNEIQSPASQPPSPNIPQNLEELKEFYAAHQSAVQTRSQREGWSKERFREELAIQNAITIELGVTKQVVRSRLYLVIDNSEYLENTAAALGVKPEQLKLLAKKRLDYEIDRAMTATAYRQTREFYKNPSWLATKFVKDIQSSLPPDDLIGPAIAANRKDAKEGWKIIKQTAQEEIAKAQPAITAAAENLANHPSVESVAQKDAVAAVKNAETVSLGRTDPKQQLDPKKSARLSDELAKNVDNPKVFAEISRRILKLSPNQVPQISASLRPSAEQLKTSTKQPNPFVIANPNSILIDALRYPQRYPKPFVDAIKSGRISASDQEIANIFETSRLLKVSPDAVILSRWGINSTQLAAGITRGRAALAADHPSIVKLSYLAADQASINALKQNLPSSLEADLIRAAARNGRAIKWHEFRDVINPFRLFTGITQRFSQIPSVSVPISGLRIESGPINSMFNFINSLGPTVQNLPSFAARPFTAVGNAIGNTIINPVKTWANTTIKDNLAKAGAWLAKTGVTAAAKDIGAALIGKGTAALLAQGVPIAGQIYGAAMLVLGAGDILKFLWEHKDKIGMGLAGLFLWGQMMLGNLIHLISSLGTIGLSTGIGALIGTMILPGVGTAIGAGLGFGAGLMINAAGGLGAALSGLGSALGSAAAGLSSFIGALTAPSAFIGLGSTIATAGLLGVGVAWAIQTFFIQPNINSALFVAPDDGIPAPGGGPVPPGCPSPIWPVTVNQGQQYFVSQGPGGNFSHIVPYQEAIDINVAYSIWRPDPNKERYQVLATHPGVVVISDSNGVNGGNRIRIQDTCGGNFLTGYEHMLVNYVQTGDTVLPGTPIGILGNTGVCTDCPHVHYVFRNGDGTHKPEDQSIPPIMRIPYLPKNIPQYCSFDTNRCNVSVP